MVRNRNFSRQQCLLALSCIKKAAKNTISGNGPEPTGGPAGLPALRHDAPSPVSFAPLSLHRDFLIVLWESLIDTFVVELLATVQATFRLITLPTLLESKLLIPCRLVKVEVAIVSNAGVNKEPRFYFIRISPNLLIYSKLGNILHAEKTYVYVRVLYVRQVKLVTRRKCGGCNIGTCQLPLSYTEVSNVLMKSNTRFSVKYPIS